MIVKNGIYTHYKGQRYKVLHICRHTETEEKLVCYEALYGDHDIWVRPYDMFIEEVTIDGVRKPRFTLLEE